jgi:hypothetical protein
MYTWDLYFRLSFRANSSRKWPSSLMWNNTWKQKKAGFFLIEKALFNFLKSLYHYNEICSVQKELHNASSDSQPGCQGCCQIWNYCLFINVLLHRVPKIVIFYQVRLPPNFQSPEGCRKLKRLKNTGLATQPIFAQWFNGKKISRHSDNLKDMF